MKILNKIVCFLSVLVLCVPLLMSSVSADGGIGSEPLAEMPLDKYYVTAGTGDMSGVDVREYDETVMNVKHPEYALVFKGWCGATTSERYKYVNNTDGLEVNYLYFDLEDSISRLKILTTLIYPYAKQNNNTRDFYYFYRYGVSASLEYYYLSMYFSFTPLRMELNSKNEYILVSDSELYIKNEIIETSGNTIEALRSENAVGRYLNYSTIAPGDLTSSYNYKVSADTTDFYENADYNKASVYSVKTWDEIYTNCDLKIIPKNDPLGGLKDQIDVKLTPEFGLDMDRIYDKNTGQNDYFKFEVTNNSDKAIQWCAFIVDSNYEDDLKLGDTDTRYLVPSYEQSKWLYITDETYYSSTVKTEKKYLGLKTETTLTANKKTGTFYFHRLAPGKTYTEYVYWENVNIQPLKSYDIRFNALPIDNLIYPSDMFSSRYFFDTLGSIMGTDFEKEDGFDDYVIDDTLYTEIYRCSFSTIEMPEFTLNVKGGGSVGNAGFDDAQTLKNNFETSTNLSDGRVNANSNYTQTPLLLNGIDVSVNLDNVSISDVKSYISTCGDFFSLLKNVLMTFPAFIWVLICFGLTALVVIGIVRYIRG